MFDYAYSCDIFANYFSEGLAPNRFSVSSVITVVIFKYPTPPPPYVRYDTVIGAACVRRVASVPKKRRMCKK